MSTETSSRFSTVARWLAPSPSLSLLAAFGEQISTLYALAQRSSHVFGSPLGPFYDGACFFQLPRFVYFGPHSSDASLRLAFLAGFDHRDLRGTLALLNFVERLALSPDIGQGLHLSFFPLVDVLGLAGLAPKRNLGLESWARSTAPELSLLEKDARPRGYHGFVRLESAAGEDVVTVRLRTPAHIENPTPGVELITSDDLSPLPVRFATDPLPAPADGPLAIADDLPFQPFELTVQLPAAWPVDSHRKATSVVLKRFVARYRNLMAYAQHL